MLRRDGSGLATIVLDRTMLPSFLPQWNDLCQRSAEDNVYYTPNYMLPLLDTVAANTDVRILTGWDGDQLISMLPVVKKGVTFPGVTAAATAWQTDYTFNCLPLLDAEQSEAAAGTIIDALATLKCAECVFPELNSDGPVCLALQRALKVRGAPFSLERKFERASLSVGPSFEEHMTAHVSAKRRRELARNRRRLEEKGKLTLRTETSGPGLAEAVQSFLSLEESGWKGKRGTALACDAVTRSFAERAFGPSGGEHTSRVDLLLLDGKPIAAGVIVFSGHTGFTVKGAYDEAYSNYGAGLLLEQDVIRSFLTGRWGQRLDAATNGSHVIDYLWPDRVKVADLVFSLAQTGASLRLRSLIGFNSTVREARAKLKALLQR
jgi:CelD/BcsL family acetyltransferase involved in cellulose biosynthesis